MGQPALSVSFSEGPDSGWPLLGGRMLEHMDLGPILQVFSLIRKESFLVWHPIASMGSQPFGSCTSHINFC